MREELFKLKGIGKYNAKTFTFHEGYKQENYDLHYLDLNNDYKVIIKIIGDEIQVLKGEYIEPVKSIEESEEL